MVLPLSKCSILQYPIVDASVVPNSDDKKETLVGGFELSMVHTVTRAYCRLSHNELAMFQVS